MEWIDLRSDTVTKPTKPMLEAMWQAPVGDDVFGEDPTVNKLEETAANMFGMEAGIFCPSGTMTNQIAIKMHTQPGDEVICDELSHVYQYEGGGIAFNSGASVRLLQGNRGRVTVAQVAEGINNRDDIHKAVSSLVVLENTSNRGGGSCYELAEIEAIKNLCKTNGLILHLDGARLFNALVEKQQQAADFGRLFDSISICLSKGLGTPVGSLLLGTKEKIKKARRIRKAFGGGMRQAGIIAAAGLYALEHHVNRLATDHIHAKLIEAALLSNPKVETVLPVETNIVIFKIKDDVNPEQLVLQLKEKGILCFTMGKQQIRFVLHLDVSEAMVQRTVELLQKI
ncbi:aminotransferase class I/II-fold pyridoxal phosphate-dependent enzyme [Lacibacter luteus]|uniref:Aminotransferase class I/II-fold pyridoxal phosphate-dependent enzyme n=1 Tax=Lacibacter luteus TaxID=2508719 RepID=A0A4Q1CE14_9BACT|nr:GntG family PLP-dependent aldolase [Lacibacter luteus]RXK58033.1 aminotransferase class I/II-fold pyridoxal phosphate-dependent enzyme [Lacibacter luteus]